MVVALNPLQFLTLFDVGLQTSLSLKLNAPFLGFLSYTPPLNSSLTKVFACPIHNAAVQYL